MRERVRLESKVARCPHHWSEIISTPSWRSLSVPILQQQLWAAFLECHVWHLHTHAISQGGHNLVQGVEPETYDPQVRHKGEHPQRGAAWTEGTLVRINFCVVFRHQQHSLPNDLVTPAIVRQLRSFAHAFTCPNRHRISRTTGSCMSESFLEK